MIYSSSVVAKKSKTTVTAPNIPASKSCQSASSSSSSFSTDSAMAAKMPTHMPVILKQQIETIHPHTQKWSTLSAPYRSTILFVSFMYVLNVIIPCPRWQLLHAKLADKIDGA